ncbi:ATP-binding protein [Dactylosporangium cerinum]|uniref:ATP-binding protein n=1 Tax=Dactylosporangium cerinum TaxID=1434730 RepID=A0ABV9WID7_9ACTN
MARPAQLPVGVAALAGRDGELRRLDALAASSAMPIVAVTGMAGVGKTALAVHWAQSRRDRFPDGQLHVDLRGFCATGAPMSPLEALRGFLDALQVPAHSVTATLGEMAASFRSVVARRRMLLVVDNAIDVEQVRPLLPGAPGCAVVVTSRNDLADLFAATGADLLPLHALEEADAVELLTMRIGAARVRAEPDAAREIARRCAGLPFALCVVAARAATRPTFQLASIVAQLRAAGGGLDGFDSGGEATGPRALFSSSYRALPPAAAHLFRLLALHPGPDVAGHAAASLAGVPVDRVRPLLSELAHASLLVEHLPGRYVLHELLRSYAAELVDPLERPAAVRRLLDHYVRSAVVAAGVASTDLPRADPDSVIVVLPDEQATLDWYRLEEASLRTALQLAIDVDLLGHARHLRSALLKLQRPDA